MTISKLKTLPALFMLVCAFFVSSAEYNNNSTIALPSCDVTITADEIYTHENGITFSGNVKVLIGFANLRIEKVTLVKRKDGRCELIPEYSALLDDGKNIGSNFYS